MWTISTRECGFSTRGGDCSSENDAEAGVGVEAGPAEAVRSDGDRAVGDQGVEY